MPRRDYCSVFAVCFSTPSLRDAHKRRGNPDVCILSGFSPAATDLNLLDCRVAALLAMTEGVSLIYPHPKS